MLGNCDGSASTASSTAAGPWSTSMPTVRPTIDLSTSDGDGLADRVVSGDEAYVDTDADGRWDVKLSDNDGDGRADGADELS